MCCAFYGAAAGLRPDCAQTACHAAVNTLASLTEQHPTSFTKHHALTWVIWMRMSSGPTAGGARQSVGSEAGLHKLHAVWETKSKRSCNAFYSDLLQPTAACQQGRRCWHACTHPGGG